MDVATRDARHLQALRELETVLGEIGFPSHLITKSDRLPQHALITRVAMPAPLPPSEIALSFYPLEADTIEHSMLLQYYLQLPYDFDAKARQQYRLVLPDLNAKAVLGHFGLDVGTEKPHYRYVQSLPVDRPITKEAVMDVVVLVGYTPALFGELLAALAKGETDAAAARKRLGTRYTP